MTGPPPEQPDAPSVGPLAQEAALLLDVVADRLQAMKPADGAAAPDGRANAPNTDDAAEPRTEHTVPAGARCPECGSVQGAYCTACPLCRFIALLRGERPEATARLVDGALLIVRTLRSLVPDPAGYADPAGGAAPTGPHRPTADQRGWPRPDPTGPPPSRRGGLEHIDIS